MLLGAEDFLVSPGLGLMLWTAFVLLVALPAAGVAVAKRQWVWFLVGFLTAGIGWVIGALQPARPGSLWARRRKSSQT
jgi:hypothetical protein